MMVRSVVFLEEDPTNVLIYASFITFPLLLEASVITNYSDVRKFYTTMSALDLLLCHKHSCLPYCASIHHSAKTNSLLAIKGYPMQIVYNRVPKSAGSTLRFLFRDQATVRKFTIFNKKIFVPFHLSPKDQQNVASELKRASNPALYERHMYFINFENFEIPQPIYINMVRDPVEHEISEYYYYRQNCIGNPGCRIEKEFLNETIDECIERQSLHYCIYPIVNGTELLSFFCGHQLKCQTNKIFALEQAKQNIINHYTVVGIVEELYNFLFVLEYLMPRYFANVRLTYMSSGKERVENIGKVRRSSVVTSERTITMLRAELSYDYELYEFIKIRFHAQLQQLLETLSNA